MSTQNTPAQDPWAIERIGVMMPGIMIIIACLGVVGYLLLGSGCASEQIDIAELPEQNVEQGGDTEWIGDNDAPSCEFEVDAWVHQGIIGTEVIGNELSVELADASPTESVSDNAANVLSVNFTAVHEDCDDLVVDNVGVYLSPTDLQGTGWYLGLESALLVDEYGEILGGGDIFACDIDEEWCLGVFAIFTIGLDDFEGIALDAGQTRNLRVFLDTRDIPAGDSIQPELFAGEVSDDGGETFIPMANQEGVLGSELVY